MHEPFPQSHTSFSILVIFVKLNILRAQQIWMCVFIKIMSRRLLSRDFMILTPRQMVFLRLIETQLFGTDWVHPGLRCFRINDLFVKILFQLNRQLFSDPKNHLILLSIRVFVQPINDGLCQGSSVTTLKTLSLIRRRFYWYYRTKEERWRSS